MVDRTLVLGKQQIGPQIEDVGEDLLDDGDELELDEDLTLEGSEQSSGPQLSARAVMDKLGLPTLDTAPPRTRAKNAGPRIGRYEIVSRLGKGGFASVLAARDQDLRRTVAVKVANSRTGDKRQLTRFVAEAQVTAQLEHPNIVPVHEMGVTPEGRFYFVMKKVAGRSLSQILAELHAGKEETMQAWPSHRLLSAFVQVCQGVGYAHDRGVLHRDLKPSNVMLGAYGEVLVMDWGLARQIEARDILGQSVDRVSGDATLPGVIMGTPGFMSPEQARGELDSLDRRSDVWSLGAILYQILCFQLAYPGQNPYQRIIATLRGPPEDPRLRRPDLAIPAALVEICLQAMSEQPELRFPTAKLLGDAVEAVLAGTQRRAAAAATSEQARQLMREAEELHGVAEQHRDRAIGLSALLRAGSSAEEKERAWEEEDQADAAERQAGLLEAEAVQKAHAALEQDPELESARDLLADYYRARHEEAEERGDFDAAARHEVGLRACDRGAHQAYLAGTGALTLVTDPPGARAELYRYERAGRRLVPVFVRELGTTPLREVELPMGSYLVLLKSAGHQTVRYPVHIRRQSHWSGIRPGSVEPAPLPLPRVHGLSADEIYVPGGWFTAGGGPDHPTRQLWVDGFVMQRYPVTNRAWMAFLNDLLTQGREQQALAWAPREQSATMAQGEMMYGRDASGRFVLQADSDGDIWQPEWPVVLISWQAVSAYAEWLSQKTRRRWRLPFELEWEKAARAVDGRVYPWGDHFDSSWCCGRESFAGRALPCDVRAFPGDESAYGLRSIAGLVREWCHDIYETAGPRVAGGLVDRRPQMVGSRETERSQRGGNWRTRGSSFELWRRMSSPAGLGSPLVGFRLCYSV